MATLRIESTTEIQDLEFSNSCPIQEDIVEALDAMDVVVESETPLTIEKYSNAWFYGTEKPSNRNWLVLGKSIKHFNGFISYTIHLIEPTKILENFCFNGMAVTGKSTLIECLETAIEKMNFQLKKHDIVISYTLRSYIGNAAGEDFIWNGQKTAREILDEIIECVDARVQVAERWVIAEANNWKKRITITAEDPNSVGTNLGADFSSITAEESTEDNDYEYEVGRIETEAVNAVSSTFIVKTQAQTLQSTEIIDDKKDRIFLTQYPIYKLRDLYVAYPDFTASFTDSDPDALNKWAFQESDTADTSGLQYRTEYHEYNGQTFSSVRPYIKRGNRTQLQAMMRKIRVSLLSYCVTREEWDAMTTSDKKTALYYDLNGQNIYGFNEQHQNWWFVTTSVIENITSGMIKLASQATNGPSWGDCFWDWDSTTGDYKYSGSEIIGTNHVWNNPSVIDVINPDTGKLVRIFHPNPPAYRWEVVTGDDKTYYYCEYEARDSVNYRAQKGTANAYFEELSILDSKANPDLNRAVNNSLATIKRIGNNTRIINKVFESFSDVYNLHDYVGSGDDKYIITKRTLSFDTGLIIATFEFTKGYNAIQIKTALNREIRTWNIPATGYVDRYIYLDAAELGVTAYDKAFFVGGVTNGDSAYGLIDGLTYYVGSRKYTQYKLPDNIMVGTKTITTNNTKMNEAYRYTNRNGKAANVRLIFSSRSGWKLTLGNIVAGTDALSGGVYVPLTIYKDPFERLIFTIIW